MQPHGQQPRQQIEAKPLVLLVQDTTELDFTQHPKTTGLPTNWQSGWSWAPLANSPGHQSNDAGDCGLHSSRTVSSPNGPSRQHTRAKTPTRERN